MEEEDYSKISVEDRCVHKVWKARLSGYEAAANIFRQIDDEKSPEWSKYIGLIKKFVVDSNAPAQEKGLEATLALVENCASAGKTVGDVMNGLVQKCVGAPKAKTKELATQIALMYIEIEKQDVVLEELLKGTENKNPKISASCIHIITLSLQEFGAKVINVSKVLKKITALLEDRDKTVREESKALLVELYRWMGPTLKAQLSNLKPTQLAEIEAEYEKQKDKQVRPSRMLRSQQAKKAQGGDVCSQDVTNETDSTGCVAEVDPYEFLDPVDILSQLPKNFYTQLEAKKWSERKEALDGLDKILAAAPKIENGDYSELVKTLKKTIQKDSNVVVIGVAIKCISGLASGLKKKFNQFSAMMMPCLFEKFKEKKQNVVIPLREAVDAVYLSTNLEVILEDIITFLDNKNPSVKSEVVSFLARAFSKSTPTLLNKKLLKPLTKALLKTLTDQDQVVRDNAAQALGTAMKVTGEKTISPFLTEIDNQKLAKIKECCEKAEILVKPQKVVESRNADQAPKKIVTQEKTVASKSSAPKPVQKKVKPSKSPVTPSLDRDDAMKQANAVIPESIKTSLFASGKEKITAYKNLKEFLEKKECIDNLGQIILTFLFCDETKQNSDAEVICARFDVINFIVETMSIPEIMLLDIVTEVGDGIASKETADIGGSTLNSLSDTFSLDCISKLLLSRDFKNNPAVWAANLNWVSNAIMKNNVSVDSNLLMEFGKNALSQSDALVRNAGLALIGTVHLQVGEDSSKNAHSPTHVPDVQATQEPNKIVIEKRSTETTNSVVTVKDKLSTDEKARIDLSTQITDQLISELGDKNWKVRAEAVGKLHTLVKGALSISSNIGEVPPVLASRISDSNSKIALASINLVESLALAMGPQCKQHTRTFLPALLKLIGDPKVWIRTAVLTCLNTWYETGGYKEFFEGEIIADALKTGSPSLRAELWNFLASKLPNITPRSLPKDELAACLPTLYSNIEDRNAEVRKGACEAVLGFMIHLGFNTMNSACDNIKGTGGTQVKILLEKTRGSVPEKLPPSKAKVGSAGSNSGRQTAMKMVAGSSATITKSVKPKGNSKLTSPGGKKDDEASTCALLQVNNLKNQRIIDDQKLKTLKWNFTTPRLEFVELLRELMLSANVNKNLIANMFHNDFRYHLKAIDALTEDLSTTDLSSLISNLDLILRWMTLRFFDTNPSVLLRGLDYLNAAFSLLITAGYQMLDYEANSFIPYLILKIGEPKDAVRNSIRAIFKHISSMYPVTKLFTFLMEGVKSKNARQRAECLDQLAWLIENYGTIVCQPTVPAAIKEIAKHIADRDSTVRNAAINCVVTAYFLDGERITKMVGQIADKDMSLLEERIKRLSKTRPVASVKPLQTVAPSVQEIDSDIHSQVREDENLDNAALYPRANSSNESPQSNRSFSGEGNNTFTLQDSPREYHTMDNHTTSHHYQHRTGLQDNTITTNGPFALDENLIDGIEREAVNANRPKIKEIDEYLKELVEMPLYQPVQMVSMTPTLSNYTKKNAVKWEITQIASSDIEKAIDSMAQIDIVLSSDKRSHLVGFIDLMVNQLVHQLIILNQSSLPDVVTCYKANFSLLMKVTNYPELCAEIKENTLYKLLDRLILLLVERRLQGLDRHEMFVRTINTLVLRCMDQSNKTNVLCALINLLYDTVNNPSASNMYKDLVAKCLWKLNRAQPEWDAQLDYNKVLARVNTFFREYPSSWWKTQDNDVPLRTVKTILHTMVKVRGMQVQDIANNVSELSQDSELYIYIKKLIRHLGTNNSGDAHSLPKESSHDSTVKPGSPAQPKLTKETRDQLSEIFKMIGDTEETSEGMKRLFTFKKSHPEADITPFLSKATPVFQQYIERGLAALEQQQASNNVSQLQQQPVKKNNNVIGITTNASSHIRKRDPSTLNTAEEETPVQDGTGKYFRKEAERLWTRLQYLKEQAGLPVDARSLDDLCDTKENKVEPIPQVESVTCDPSVQSLKERLQLIKPNFE